MDTKQVYYIRHKQASVNRWIGKYVKKFLQETLKITCEEVNLY